MKRDRESRTWPFQSFCVHNADTGERLPFFKAPDGRVWLGATAGCRYKVVVQLFEDHDVTHATLFIDGRQGAGSYRLDKNGVAMEFFQAGNKIGHLVFSKMLSCASTNVLQVEKPGSIVVGVFRSTGVYEKSAGVEEQSSNIPIKVRVMDQDGKKFFEQPSLCTTLQNTITKPPVTKCIDASVVFHIGCQYDNVEHLELREGYTEISAEEAMEHLAFKIIKISK